MPYIAQISLNTSLFIYLIWLLPQIILNFKRQNTKGLSILMHGILCLGYVSDLVYGFGREMQWQYRTITIVGLISLAVQHYQFFRYGLHNEKQKIIYVLLSALYILILCYAIGIIYWGGYSKEFYNFIGMLANACWLSYALPQIIKNYTNQSTEGLSLLFVLFAIFLNVCDATSAWTLNWDYPSKIGPAISFVSNMILIFQVIYYGRRYRQIRQLAVDS